MLTIQSINSVTSIILVNDLQQWPTTIDGKNRIRLLFSDNDINWYPLAIEQMHCPVKG